MEQLTQRLTAAQIPYTLQEPLCSHCTFKIGGPAAVFVRPQNEMQLTEALAACRQTVLHTIFWAMAATSYSQMPGIQVQWWT